MKARIVIGANYGDEGKGTVTASYTKKASGSILNVLTNGGAQRGHSILTEDGTMTFSHFGSGTYHGADNFYSRFFILNPMKFAMEYETLLVKPRNIYRDSGCRWTTPYDSMANLIKEQSLDRHASCGMGIWNTIKRSNETPFVGLDTFVNMDLERQMHYLIGVRNYYEKTIEIPIEWKNTWLSDGIIRHFIGDCLFLRDHTKVLQSIKGLEYNEVIFENGQGLLLKDTGVDTPDTTPSDTGISYALTLSREMEISDIVAHYVTRPYITRHGDGFLPGEKLRKYISSNVDEDRTNHYNEFQGDFRYGLLDIENLKERIDKDACGMPIILEVTHCDEMDREKEFRSVFNNVNFHSSPFI